MLKNMRGEGFEKKILHFPKKRYNVSMNIKKIIELLSSFATFLPSIREDIEISDLAFDSRKVSRGSVFFAIPGHLADGTSFIPQAIERGASLIVAPSGHTSTYADQGPPVVLVPDVREALSRVSGMFYLEPSQDLVMVGITGTNGKTSTAWIVAQLVAESMKPSVYLGTLGHYFMHGSEIEKKAEDGRTTVDPLTLQKSLRDAATKESRYGVIEVTSHGLVQHRTSGVEWDVAAFSNLTQDHLDSHGTMEAYFEAKSLLFFRELLQSKKKNKAAVINIDDPYGERLAKKIKEVMPDIRLLRVSERTKQAELYVKKIIPSSLATTLIFSCNEKEYSMTANLLGSFNVSNLLLSFGIGLALGKSPEYLVAKGPDISSVPGRLELVNESLPRMIVDYAHTPDALEKIQMALLDILNDEARRNGASRGRLITVFGCGGDRDKTKRPLMGKMVARMSDIAIITSDNPRTEDPEVIIEDIIPGLTEVRSERDIEYQAITDRRCAIQAALKIASRSDIILIAGKGHEDYQEIHGVKHPFDDRVVGKEELLKKSE
jgi:UDP-N-acetylmuramoyl-L-alanyl-D-glutamate--2,6-diaminopimelate ligase